MKAKAAVFMGANVPFEVREFEITDTPAGYGLSLIHIFLKRPTIFWTPVFG